MPAAVLNAIAHLPIIRVASEAFLASLGPNLTADQRSLIAQLSEAQSGVLLAIFHSLRRRAADGWLRVSSAGLIALLEAVLASQRPTIIAIAIPVVELLTRPGVALDLNALSNHKLAVYVLKFYKAALERKSEVPVLARMAIGLVTAVAASQECCIAMVRVPEFHAVVMSAGDADPSLVHLNWQFFAQVAQFSDSFLEILKDAKMAPMFTAAIHSKDLIVIKRFLEVSIDIWKNGRDDVVEGYCRAMRGGDRLPRIAILYKQRKREFKDNEGHIALIEEFTRAARDRRAPGVQEFLEDFWKHIGGPEAQARGRGRPPVRKALSQMLESPQTGI
jgi:hypothetical protein